MITYQYRCGVIGDDIEPVVASMVENRRAVNPVTTLTGSET